MGTSRRNFIKNTAMGSAGLMLSSVSAQSYNRILGANDRVHVAIMGLGRRLGGYTSPLSNKENNVEISYLCDVMAHQRENAANKFSKLLDYSPKLENDIRRVFEDKKVDAVFNAAPDHWHTPGTIMAMQNGKHVYVEKPCSNTMEENELIVEAAEKYGLQIQMGNQQRSSKHSQYIIGEIHKGLIGKPYKAIAFYTNKRGRVPNQQAAAVPDGLDWDLFQGPAPRRDYTSETWNYNWHWYGWDYGTAEAGNNGTHEMDIARWALQVDFPESVYANASKGQFLDDGWEMYDTMEAIFRYGEGKSIVWDGRSRNGYDTYGYDRGTIIHGSEGTVFVNRNNYVHYDRKGAKVKDYQSEVKESGIALGGEGGATNAHVRNFLEAIRGKEKLLAPIDDASISMALVHYANVSYRINKGFDIDESGRMLDRDAMKLWTREYEPGWEIEV